jgi:ribosomal protein L16 Arg81 hydroxylase
LPTVIVNLYVTPPGAEVSLIPHSDYQCSLMVQLTGRKRWRLWKKPSAEESWG